MQFGHAMLETPIWDSNYTCMERSTHMLDRIALVLAIIGGLNWGSIGLFRFDIVAWICGGQDSIAARIIFTVVGLSALWCISLLFRNNTDLIESRD